VKLAEALKQVIEVPAKTKISFHADFNDRAIITSVSAILLSEIKVGWVLVLEDVPPV
jgi:hypothetical protein